MRPGETLSLIVTLAMSGASMCLLRGCGGREGKTLRVRIWWLSDTPMHGFSTS